MTGFKSTRLLAWTSIRGFASFTPLVFEMLATALSIALSSSPSTVTTASKAPRTTSTWVTQGRLRISKRPVRSASL